MPALSRRKKGWACEKRRARKRKMDAFLKQTRAKLWIAHDIRHHKDLPKPPSTSNNRGESDARLFLALTIVLAVAMAALLGAQTSSAEWKQPRTPWGDPTFKEYGRVRTCSRLLSNATRSLAPARF